MSPIPLNRIVVYILRWHDLLRKPDSTFLDHAPTGSIRVTNHQTNLVTVMLEAQIPVEGIGHFRAYEDAVLPLLPEFE